MSDIDRLSDTEVLAMAGTMGPGVIGQELYDRAARVREATDNGRFGPAILATSPPAKPLPAALAPAVAVAAPGAPPAAASVDEDANWDALTKSGAKMLAQQHGVEYPPVSGRPAIIGLLKAAGVKPPPRIQDGDPDEG